MKSETAWSKSPASKNKSISRIHVSTKAKRFIWQRAKGMCERCKSTWALQIDHIIPVALGGTSNPENLRLLCRTCNQRAAIEILGQAKMQPYLDQPQGN